ncbi:MAG TPA: hypothetical protein VHZ07_03760 [Bryobacteraceae bacterium]|jgi:hypothetical protein|nr:hypothetical protein [Bryobacteraceae bacterium]
MSEATACLNEWETRYVLAALNELEVKWRAIQRASKDEDVIAEYRNDLVELIMTRDRIKSVAIDAFGSSVANFNRTPITAASPKS